MYIRIYIHVSLAVPNSDTPLFDLSKNQTDDKHPQQKHRFFQENQSFEKLSSVFAFKNKVIIKNTLKPKPKTSCRSSRLLVESVATPLHASIV